MKIIAPYKNSQDALVSLDNGGRFYNLLTNADDGEISTAELSTVAGVFTDKQQMILYLEMSIAELAAGAIENIRTTLSVDLKAAYEKYRPSYLRPSEALSKGKLASNAIITGVPKLIGSEHEFCGFIMIPIIANNVTIFTMVPIIDEYDVYELRDETSATEFIIAHAHDVKKLPECRIRCGGILKELKVDAEDVAEPKKYLESLYYSIAEA